MMLATKARRPRISDQLLAVRSRLEAVLAQRLRTAFRLQARRIVRRCLELNGSKAIERKAIEDDLWNPQEEAAITLVLNAGTHEIVAQVTQALRGGLGDISLTPSEHILQNRLAESATRVRGINEVTRRAIRDTIAEGRRLGLSDWQIAYGAAANDQHGAFRGLKATIEETYKGRAETIARTEVGHASNLTGLDWYDGAGYTRVRVRDGTGCGWTRHDDPLAANGRIVTTQEARSYPLAHPNCRRAFDAIVSSRSRRGGTPTAPVDAAPSQTTPTPPPPSPLAVALQQHGVTDLSVVQAIDLLAGDLQRRTINAGREFAGALHLTDGSRVGSIVRGASASVDIGAHLDLMKAGEQYLSMHTHPQSSSYSWADAAILARYRTVQIMMVVGEDGTRYLLSPADVTRRPSRLEIIREYETERAALKPDYDAMRSQGMTEQAAWREITHRIWNAISGRLGFLYDRIEVPVTKEHPHLRLLPPLDAEGKRRPRRHVVIDDSDGERPPADWRESSSSVESTTPIDRTDQDPLA